MKKLFLVFLIFLVGCSVKVSETSSEEIGISIFNENENLMVDFVPEGRVSIKEIIDVDFFHAIVISKTGEVNLISSDFYINKNKSVFVTYENRNIKNIEGIYLTDKYNSITNAYFETKEYLKSDKKVMTVLLDGFSFNQFKILNEKNDIPFLSKYFKYPALSVYTPVTNAGYAAIITGQTPNINGVHDRSVREMNVDSIFEYANSNNKNSLLLEGDIKILDTEIEPELHIDINKDKDTDDEMYKSALNAVNENYDLIFVHFHGIDDRGHSYGPYSEETMEYIKIIDQYLLNLSKVWDGAIIIVPDHGMHETSEGGGHGICVQSDMVVPYFIKEK
ncbi:alkaline phosphatase family protein [Sedimentibacter sp. MB31-C6]|uniref:alkaline phosphatase family protein n=1 Tax=Sedimentibacter sp. MB31-C6 TaxID=3109366 RepID=UPI002DDD2B57|nr:alkaline phosphatase family protein [Sedimentibacter sp. MB36-C1]WSI02926.1 alkaline phosphatase family protein [Sedimentibacter sp. MB36-C1]